MEEEINRIYRNTWITKGCRFIASKRYKKHHNYSNITITLTSVSILFLNLLVLIEDRNAIFSNDNITYITICLSILTLAFSLIVSAKNYQTIENKFHDCGREISKIHDTSCYYKSDIDNITKDQVVELQKKYQSIIEKYDINQDQIDYDLFKCRNLNDFYIKKKDQKWYEILLFYISRTIFWIKTQLHYFVDQYLIYIIVISTPVVVLFFLNK